MSRTHPSPVDAIEVGYPCQDCGAAPGDWCQTRGGRWAHYLHASRWWQAQRAIERGA